jgi:hypothetical protein
MQNHVVEVGSRVIDAELQN